jgi:hypothetical protein
LRERSSRDSLRAGVKTSWVINGVRVKLR